MASKCGLVATFNYDALGNRVRLMPPSCKGGVGGRLINLIASIGVFSTIVCCRSTSFPEIQIPELAIKYSIVTEGDKPKSIIIVITNKSNKSIYFFDKCIYMSLCNEVRVTSETKCQRRGVDIHGGLYPEMINCQPETISPKKSHTISIPLSNDVRDTVGLSIRIPFEKDIDAILKLCEDSTLNTSSLLNIRLCSIDKKIIIKNSGWIDISRFATDGL